MLAALFSIQCIAVYFYFLRSWVALGLCMLYLAIVTFQGTKLSVESAYSLLLGSQNLHLKTCHFSVEETFKEIACFSLMGIGCVFVICVSMRWFSCLLLPNQNKHCFWGQGLVGVKGSLAKQRNGEGTAGVPL